MNAPTKAKHSATPWDYRGANKEDGGFLIHSRGGECVAVCSSGSADNGMNAERITACVNALRGIPDPKAAIEKAREALRYYADLHIATGRDQFAHDALQTLAALTPSPTTERK